ncbi:metallophosphoesterase, partial [Escherichia coli]|nr:metallophosphoesterase [Escherichia coli]
MPSTRYQKINAHHYRHIWVVGDIHGEYQLLQSRLHQLSFFPETDLLISVGDNIDRGPESLKEGANKRGNSSRLTQSFHFFMFEPIFSPVNALN